MTLPELTIGDLANLDETLHAIALSAQQIFSADLCLMVAVNPFTQRLIEPPWLISDPDLPFDHTQLSEVAQGALSQELTRFARSIAQDRETLDQLGLREISSLVAVTLRVQQHRPLAVLFIGYNHPHTFDSTAQEKLQVFAQNTALTLKNIWLLHRYREVTKIGQEINQNLESLETHKTLFEKLQAQLAEIIDTSYFLLLALHQPRKLSDDSRKSDDLREVEFVDLYMSEKGQVKYERVSADFPFFQNPIPKLVRHYNKEVGKSVRDLKQIEGTENAIPQSLILVPLIFRDDSFGVLSVQHTTPNVYDDADLQFLELIGNQVAQSLANQRLYGYLNELNETGQKLTQQLDSERLFQEVVDRILKTAEADIVVLYPYDKKRPEGDQFILPLFISRKVPKEDRPKPNRIRPDDVAWLVLKKDEPIFEKNTASLYEALGGNTKKRAGNFEEREQVKSTAALPLKIGDETVGILFVNYRVPQRFDAAQKTLIQGLANYTAIAIRNSRLLNRSNRLARLRDIDHAISSTLDLNQILETILNEAKKGDVPADEAAILLYNEQLKALEIKAGTGRRTEELKNQGLPIVRGKGLTWEAYTTKKAIRVGNVTHPDLKKRYHKFSEETISEIDVPLLDGEENAIGVINFESNQENAYSQANEDFITNLAAQAVVAVKNAQLYEKQQRTATEQGIIQDIGRKIISHLNLSDLLEEILRESLEITRSSAGQVLLYDPRRGDLYIPAEHGVPDELKGHRLAKGKGIVWEAINQKRALRVDITDPAWKKKYIKLIPNAKWELAVPIFAGDKVYGAINIESRDEFPLTEKDERLLIQLADLVLIALQNAEQYEEVGKRKRQLEGLHNVDIQIIEQQGDIGESIRAIIEAAGLLTSAEVAGLHFYLEGLPSINYLSRDEEVQNGLGLPLWKPLSRDIYEGTPSRPGIVAHVMRTGKPYATKGAAQEDPIYLGDSEIRSEIAVPLELDGNVIGVLNLESQRDYAFAQDDVEVLKLLAEQAVIAIQNALNFIKAREESKKAREESKRFELLVNVGRALGEITVPEQKQRAFEICFDEAMKQYSEGQVIYRRYDKEREEFVLEFALEKFEMVTHITPKNIKRANGLNGQVARERRAILVKDVDNLEEGIAPPTTHPDVKTLIVAPVIFEDHYYGNVTLRHTIAGYYQEPDRLLLWGMATQLAITLRRLEAVEAQQEVEQQARSMEVFTQLGQSAYEITHRLGNELGLVATCVNQIRDVLEEHKIASTVIDEELNKIVKDVGQVLSMCTGVKEKVAGLRDEGKSTPLPVILPVKALLEEAKWSSSPANIEMSWVVADDLGSVKIVTGQIIDILYTLITNAIEAMPEGGRITVRAYKSGSDVHVEVADNGPGISPANQSKIFNLFFSTKRSSGFGLWSAQRYARANGGDLTVSSELGKGATFTLKLPLASSPENGHS